MRVVDSLLRRLLLQALMCITARALGVWPRCLCCMSHGRALRAYALFTAWHLRRGADAATLSRLRSSMRRAGRLLRLLAWVRRPDQADRLAVALYRCIGIDLECHLPHRLCMRRCFFSRYYTPAACVAASALDEGLFCGLYADGRLRFAQRISAGCASCLAQLKVES